MLTDPAVLRQLEENNNGRLPEKHVKTLPDLEMPRRVEETASSAQLDWLGCVSRKSGLPRWLLAATIFMSILVFVWLCFATASTAPDTANYKRLVGIILLCSM